MNRSPWRQPTLQCQRRSPWSIPRDTASRSWTAGWTLCHQRHGVRRPPPASTGYCSSTGSYSSSLHRSPRGPVQPTLHELLFIQPSTSYCSTSPPPTAVHPASTVRYSTGYCSTTPTRAPLHHLLFIQHSTGLSCSSSPPRVPVHPAPTGSVDRGPVHPEATPRVLFIHSHRSLFIQTPPQRSLFIQRGSIDRLQLAAVAKESLDRVQLTAIDRSLRFS